jgi:hypothetical protein
MVTKIINNELMVTRTQYGLYQEPVSLCSAKNSEKWQKATFWIFDAPHFEKPYEVRFLPYFLIRIGKN